MKKYFLDTNILIWLQRKKVSKFPKKVFSILDDSDEKFLVSHISFLEIQYLFEVGKLASPPLEFLMQLQHDFKFEFSEKDLFSIVLESIPLTWTRDPFDRMIVANAIAENAELITADRNILKHYDRAIWE